MIKNSVLIRSYFYFFGKTHNHVSTIRHKMWTGSIYVWNGILANNFVAADLALTTLENFPRLLI